jgi:ribose 5-phosphate isomerase B
MKIAVAGDHAGFHLKAALVADLRSLGHQVEDLGAKTLDPLDDYPDFAILVGEALIAGRAERGLIVCGSGVGVCVAANKHPGVRAGVCHDTYSARQGVEHDDMNVLCLGERVVGAALARELVRVFVSATFSHEEKHQRRLDKVLAVERRFLGGAGSASPSRG